MLQKKKKSIAYSIGSCCKLPPPKSYVAGVSLSLCMQGASVEQLER